MEDCRAPNPCPGKLDEKEIIQIAKNCGIEVQPYMDANFLCHLIRKRKRENKKLKSKITPPPPPRVSPQPPRVSPQPPRVSPQPPKITIESKIPPAKYLPAEGEILFVTTNNPEWGFYANVAKSYSRYCVKCLFDPKNYNEMPEDCNKCAEDELVYTVDKGYFKDQINNANKNSFLVFGTTNKNRICVELDQKFSKNLGWNKNTIQKFGQECTGKSLDGTIPQMINTINDHIVQTDELVSSVIFGEIDEQNKEIYINIICGKKGAKTLIQRLIYWAKDKGYKSIKLYALAYVINYYRKFGFDHINEKYELSKVYENLDKKSKNQPDKNKAYCYGWAVVDSVFKEYLTELYELGFAHACNNDEDKEEVREKCRKDQIKKKKIYDNVDDCFFSECASGGYLMRLLL